jgi:hypothetical protein
MQRFKWDAPNLKSIFDFQCKSVSLDDVVKPCDNEKTKDINFMDHVKSVGNRLFYNKAYRYNISKPKWAKMTQPEASDPVLEHSELVFLDIDWESSLNPLTAAKMLSNFFVKFEYGTHK